MSQTRLNVQFVFRNPFLKDKERNKSDLMKVNKQDNNRRGSRLTDLQRR